MDRVRGYRTYAIAALTALGALGAWLDGSMSAADAIAAALTAVGLITARVGARNDAARARDTILAAPKVAAIATTAAAVADLGAEVRRAFDAPAGGGPKPEAAAVAPVEGDPEVPPSAAAIPAAAFTSAIESVPLFVEGVQALAKRKKRRHR